MNEGDVRLLHTSDWHLGAPIGWGPDKQAAQNWIPKIRRDREAAIDEVIRVACTNRVDAVLVAGDILDQPELPIGIRGTCEKFLRERVVTPLASDGIRLCLTPGTHDWLPKRGHRDSSLALLRALANDFPENVVLLEPARFPGRRVTTTTEIKGHRIATEPPPKGWQGSWIEFLHDSGDSRIGQPIYRAYGDRHVFTREPKHCAYYPGSPFVRSSASDNGHTDVGPRHVLIVTINSSANAPGVRRERLPVEEVAVLKRARTRDEWRLFYERDYEKSSWKTSTLTGSPAVVVDQVRRSYPTVGYVTLIVPNEDRAVQRYAMKLGRSIVGSRPGIISLSLNH